MTFRDNRVPSRVFSRWKSLNPAYEIDFSTDADCFEFLMQNFNPFIARFFEQIPVGMYKADLWRLCKLYLHGGVYADIDSVPHVDMDREFPFSHHNTFFSCLSKDDRSIFQAFMFVSRPKNPLILHFLLSFLLHRPFQRPNGPTFDMYQCLVDNIGVEKLLPEITYRLETIKIRVPIGTSRTATKAIPLHYFPPDIPYHVEHSSPEKFRFDIQNNTLWVRRIDQSTGWEHPHECNLVLETDPLFIYLFPESLQGHQKDLYKYYIAHQGKKIFDCRDRDYIRGRGYQQ